MSNTRRGLPITSSRIEQIFPKLTEAQIHRVAAHGQIRIIERGEVLYEQGHSAASFFEF
jgi:CRP-like cAMP-binding protein